MTTIVLRVDVTQEDIDKGGHHNHDCPHQRAITRVLQETLDTTWGVCVDYRWARFGKNMGVLGCAGTYIQIPLPGDVPSHIKKYDMDRIASPISYVLEFQLPEETA